MISGFDTEALYMLTGAPATMFRFEEGDPNSIFEVLRDAFTNRFVVTAATGDKKDIFEFTGRKGVEGTKEIDGIVPGHNYSILGFLEIFKSNGGWEIGRSNTSIKLVKIRNPWGDTEWKGAW